MGLSILGPMGLIVAKFGGTSLGDGPAITRSLALAEKQEGLGLLVVSATAGTTDRIASLIQLPLGEGGWARALEILGEIGERHHLLARNLGTTDRETLERLDKIVEEGRTVLKKGKALGEDLSPWAKDALLSMGELLSSTLVAAQARKIFHRPVEWLDVREVLKTDERFGRALPLLSEISLRCSVRLKDPLGEGRIFVTQGFVGSTLEGQTTTLGRGGSDYSAALLAEGVDADELQIWTDVPGVATGDPRLCSKTKTLEELSFEEAAELATFGAKVLHPSTVWPAMRKDIPIFVGDSSGDWTLGKKGTWVKRETTARPLIRAMALRERQSILTLSTPRMVSTYGYLHDIFKAFKKHRVSVDLVSTSEISVSITLGDDLLDDKALIDDLSLLGKVDVESGYGLVSLIGNQINHTAGLAAKILNTVSSVNIRLLCSGAGQHNFSFLVDESDARDVLQKLHGQFLE
ncbi:MAG: lysine-sensitive aspartokinase 3 [Bacteriovoracales bacterium]|nr:lysine-sensitive aspartokinase 3 [Bacteriovoracales bacterium]